MPELLFALGILGFLFLAGMGIITWLLNTLVNALKDDNSFE
jgi:hypothetical protein